LPDIHGNRLLETMQGLDTAASMEIRVVARRCLDCGHIDLFAA
jgi:hypothetical protein